MTLSARHQRIVLLLILFLGLALRLKGIHNPLIDHPGWRQGDEAAIARNFAFVDGNPFHPQADYNGPGPNYVELELQIVPYLASLLYRIFGVHEVFGRLLSIGFSVGTIGLLYAFGRRVFASPLAGLCAALLYAIAPGAVYYGRTFQPEAAMAFFFTCALFAGVRSISDDTQPAWRGTVLTAVLLALAILAKPVALIALIPLFALSLSRFGWLGSLTRPQNWLIVGAGILPYWIYDTQLRAIATWRWASGITTLHVIPDLLHALVSPAALWRKIGLATDAITMLAHTMLGPVIFTLLIFGFLTPQLGRTGALFRGWLLAAVLYLFIVVTVEPVDYYLFPFVPLAALAGGGYLGAAIGGTNWSTGSRAVRLTAIASLAIGLLITIVQARNEVSPYYEYNRNLVRQAHTIAGLLPPDALIVMGHLDPSVLYYLNHRGWEEDAYAWTPFDEQSAIAKGARYFINVEPARLARNVELSAWLKRFPLLPTPPNVWQVYVTDPDELVPGAEAAWRKFRAAERHSKTHNHHRRAHRRRPVSATLEPLLPAGSPATEDQTSPNVDSGDSDDASDEKALLVAPGLSAVTPRATAPDSQVTAPVAPEVPEAEKTLVPEADPTEAPDRDESAVQSFGTPIPIHGLPIAKHHVVAKPHHQPRATPAAPLAAPLAPLAPQGTPLPDPAPTVEIIEATPQPTRKPAAHAKPALRAKVHPRPTDASDDGSLNYVPTAAPNIFALPSTGSSQP